MTTLSVQTAEGVTLRFDLAGAGSRLAAGLLDGLILGTGYAFVGLVLLVASRFDTSGVVGFATGIFLGGAMLLALLYHFLFHALRSGQTPGKSLIGIRVMSADGYPPSLLALFLRTLVWPLDVLLFVPAPLGLFVIVATPKHQRLGDLAAGTLVLRTPRAQVVPEPWPNESWSALPLRTLPLTSGLAARVSARDLEFLRQLLTRTELDSESRRQLFIETARHYSALLDLGPFEDARIVLKELYLFARETVQASGA